jgi:hypothetical protein
MKPYIKLFLVLLFTVYLSCEDVIDLDVPTAKPRLVIDAALDWQKGSSGNNQSITLSTSTAYFDNSANQMVTDARVKVTNTNSNVEYVFLNQNDGTYTISNFIPVVNDTYRLDIVYNNETYTATETLKSVAPIKNVEQSLENERENAVLEVSLFWDDPENETNFYLIRLAEEEDIIPYYEYYPDEFVNGNTLEASFEKERDDDDEFAEFNPGDVVNLKLFGISQQYNNYISLLLDQHENGGNQFSPIPVQLKGNCINTNTPENYAFGYFRLSEFDVLTYTFE